MSENVHPKEKSAPATVKVRFRSKSYKIEAGDEVEVDRATADQLIADKHAVEVK